MKHHLFLAFLAMVSLLVMLASTQASASVPLPNPAASSPQQSRLATPTPKPPSRNAGVTSSTSVSSTLYFPFVAGGVSPLPPIIPLTTKVLTTATTSLISAISPDSSVITFTQTTAQLNGLVPGNVIVSDVAPAAPYGFLRKVTSVSNAGGQVVVQTQATTIEESVQQGEVYISQTMQATNPQRATFAKGVRAVRVPSAPNAISIQLNNVVLYDEDGNENTTNDQISANGSVSLEPRFNFRMKIQDFQLKEFYCTMTASETAQLRIASTMFVTAKAEKVLATFPQGPLFLTIGPFPITVYPVIYIVAGIDGTVSANVSTGLVTQTLTETAGASYANNTWSPIQQFSNQFQNEAPTLAAGGGFAIKGYTGAKLKILFYGAVGPDISVNAYLKLEANPLQTPWWKLYGGLEVPVGISIDIFSHVVAGYSAVVIDYRILLAQASTPPPTDMVSVLAGNFQMGCDSSNNGGGSCNSWELPLHTIYLNVFNIDKYEVTNARYAQCVAAGACTAPSSNSSQTRPSYV